MNITLFELHLDDATIAPALGGSEALDAVETEGSRADGDAGRSWGRLFGLVVLLGVGAAAAARWRRADEYEVEVEIGEESERVAAE
jgi:hypothetical protein